ncbi:hypothetical protein X275_08650 [Marinitoga sp. 1197]|uniref:lipocalin-like domain-containing protein n=1 Tax=Marinitoga sp. 1197 TaxID=1428449 RepID=UPI000640CB9F|nr:lipocalin-like domain-containing protein [Marinitoga sp. 1197]KLO21598.1 hypothetical protein X275_08650 [Marinitoga sp. 1197]
MRNHVLIPYREKEHGDFEDEWLPHKGVSGWWYITGYLRNKENPENIFSYQYTFLRAKIQCITLKVLQLALTDVSKKNHFFKQKASFFGKRIFIDEKKISYFPYAVLKKNEEGMSLAMDTKEFSINLILIYGKGGIWHGDNGILIMGVPKDSKQRTVYYSYTNMLTKGKLTIKAENDAEDFEVIGKSWFDRQWGPFNITDSATHWEWFSLRFFDDEEIMLFSFPQHPYQDGTYIDKGGKNRRIQNFTIKEKKLIEVDGYVFSYGWNVIIHGVKDEVYEIVPLMNGQVNIAYFELMAKVLDSNGKHVGYAFVELLPGVRSIKKKTSIKNLLKKS